MSSFERVRRSAPTEIEPFQPGRVASAAAPSPAPFAAGGGAAPEIRASVFPDIGRNGGSAGERRQDAALAETAALAAEADRMTLRQAAYDEGFAAGRAAVEQERLGGATAFVGALAEVARFRSGLLDRYQTELLELALGIARKVVQRELAEHPEHWLGMIREAVRQALDREQVRVRVGTVLHAYLREHLPALRAALDDVQELELVEDSALADCGCIVETRTGDLDLGVDSQIGAVRGALTQGQG